MKETDNKEATSEKPLSKKENAKPKKQRKTGKINSKDATRTQIRGSSLLLFGRFISVGLNFASQVLIVRYLSQADYGAWAYALSIIAFFQGFSTLGLKRAITRFIPIYHEQEQYGKLFGTIFLTLITIVLTGLVFIGAIYISPDSIAKLISGDAQPVAILLILIFMVPVEAIDLAIIGLFASFASPKVIFTRKHLFGPGIKLLVSILLIVFQSNVLFLAYGYLSVNALAVLVYSFILIRLMKKQGILKKFRLKEVIIPFVEVFSFTIPLLTSDLVSVLMHSSGTMILGYFHNTTEVAFYRVILPASHFNKLVMTSFALLYTPLAARLFAKEDFAGINHLYWKTAVWLGVLSFPLFALTFSMAKPLTLLLYEARYEQAWVYLQLISLGYYFNVVMGFNGLTLKVLGKVRYVVIINLIAVVINLILNLALIPPFGALGAAIATCVGMIIHNILKQAGLRLASGISVFDRNYSSFYVVIATSALGLFLFQYFVTQNIFILFPLAAVVSFMVLKLCQHQLNVEETFPELLKLPILKYVFSLKLKRPKS